MEDLARRSMALMSGAGVGQISPKRSSASLHRSRTRRRRWIWSRYEVLLYWLRHESSRLRQAPEEDGDEENQASSRSRFVRAI